MAKRNGSTKSKLEQLANWNRRPFIDKMLDEGISPNSVHKWINENGLKISVATVYAYAKKRKEAIMQGVKIEVFLKDKRHQSVIDDRMRAGKKKPKPKTPPKKDNVDDLESYKAKVIKDNLGPKGSGKGNKDFNYNETLKDDEQRAQFNKTVKHVKTDLEILDTIIDKGWKTLNRIDFLSPDMAIKAIKLKNELTGGAHNGLTIYGLEEIRMREAARENAILTVLLEFIPEEKHNEVIARMEEETQKYYESIGMKEAYDKMKAEQESEEPAGSTT